MVLRFASVLGPVISWSPASGPTSAAAPESAKTTTPTSPIVPVIWALTLRTLVAQISQSKTRLGLPSPSWSFGAQPGAAPSTVLPETSSTYTRAVFATGTPVPTDAVPETDIFPLANT